MWIYIILNTRDYYLKMIRMHEYKLENHLGFNKHLARAMIFEAHERLKSSTYRGVNYDIIIRNNKEMGFSGVLICKKSKRKHAFKYSYVCNRFEIN